MASTPAPTLVTLSSLRTLLEARDRIRSRGRKTDEDLIMICISLMMDRLAREVT